MQKRHAIKSDSKPVKVFLTLQGNRGTNGKITQVNLVGADTMRPTTMEENQTCFALKLDVPISAFDVPVYEVRVDQMIPEEVKAEVQSWINGEND